MLLDKYFDKKHFVISEQARIKLDRLLYNDYKAV